jgi:ribosomal protein S27AE
VPAASGAYGTGNFIALPGGLWSSKRVPVTRYVCGNCGFTEEWVDEATHLQELRRRFGAR